jgi:hypothetical protein
MSNLYEGLIVEVKKNGVVNHPGILVRSKTGWSVIHNTPKSGMVVVDTLESFMNGEPLRFPTRYKKYLPDLTIVQRAWALVGKEWNLNKYNCQHFVTHVCGNNPKSPDLFIAVCLVLVITGYGITYLARR